MPSSDGSESRRTEHEWWQYRVVATVEFESMEMSIDEPTLSDVKSEWMDHKERAVNLADELSESGYNAYIRTRRRGSFASKDFDKIPGER